jgi:hypothetical protein
MERFGPGLKIAGADYQLLVMVWNTPLTELPIETSALNAAIEMNNATIAYSIAVAPASSRGCPVRCERMKIPPWRNR